ncbi:halocarboxylic acid dehydrogenase DehI family protein [Thermomicrobium sp. CFH 73360]|uniref:halocarboxylic acid dehydrogenase DehI family protein n=1 Tax=Thermomicrobium sp. CFH 73360 TaxID=2951987 RepID=UPI002076BBFD|nr:halocarboxylic acid dehydrogenase DehI family protein [Thermomicrobium sp. CFH 73360]MCM8745669.1 halocarboxylic acid dehydrogenase DehI family protein [Thermomicrobium sp. CFH 73360]
MQGHLVERGLALLQEIPEVWPSKAPARIHPIYDDLRTALRTPDVPFAFRFLAHWPPYLAYTIRQFSPFVRSRAFEDAADTLRAEGASALAQTPQNPAFESVRALVLREHYLAPKVLLILTAFAVGLRGRTSETAPPLGTTLPTPEPIPVRPAELPRALDERITSLPEIGLRSGKAQALLDELAALRGIPSLDDLSRVLAVQDLGALSALNGLRRTLHADALEATRHLLLERADRATRRLTLPGSKVLPDFMVPHSALPDIEAVVTALQAIALEVLIDATLGRVAMDGASAAQRSPYPITVGAQQDTGA